MLRRAISTLRMKTTQRLNRSLLAFPTFSSSTQTATPSLSDVLLLTDEQVEKLLTPKALLDANRDAFLSAAKGTAEVPDRIIIKQPETKGVALFKPAQIGEALGLKVVCTRPDNPAKKLPGCPAQILLLDRESGFVKCIMDATYLTAARTAAGSAIATTLLARENAKVLTVFGAGAQAEQHIRLMIHVRPIREVIVVNRDKPRGEAMIKRLASFYPTIQWELVIHDFVSPDSSNLPLQKAIAKADIICTTTGSSVPIFSPTYLPEGCHLNCVGGYGDLQEIHEGVVSKAKIIVDCDEAYLCADIKTPLDKKLMKKDQIIGTMGQALLMVQEKNIRTWRDSPSQITLFKSVGTAVQDLVTAHAVFEQAQRKRSKM